jgi:hypothetical protein
LWLEKRRATHPQEQSSFADYLINFWTTESHLGIIIAAIGTLPLALDEKSAKRLLNLSLRTAVDTAR